MKPLQFPYLFYRFLYRALIVKVSACANLPRNLDIAPGLGVTERLDLMGKDHGREGRKLVVGKGES
jgi:hypothetical protein